ncbi:MAG: hypothetical protein AAGA08_17050 [Pseudomonadota bacterium]
MIKRYSGLFIDCSEDGQAYAARRLIRTVDDINNAVSTLEAFMQQLNIMDVRHDDFASDADLREHLLSLKAISKALHDAAQPGGPLEHFERSQAEG